ncbi:FAD:protein FMN transferase [Leifsonia shinshuensis]|uniref:FAD:protein FMN transferase n=1 Tax=Leifsonia shinshuensis TaxID=150026 RepID=UPI001F50AFD6|nr:FAD:protein FMN transferase [Leifsonia shinshuensis]MCI0155635.1 FAD:protein FMN transferase [Leifsonia shinshuensis]
MGAPADPDRPATPVGASREFSVWGLTGRIVVTDPDALADALRIAEVELAAITTACSRFTDSELSRVNAAAGRDGGIELSPLLAEFVAIALAAAADTDGDVDPTLGGDLDRLGYDRDFATLPLDGQTAVGMTASAARRRPGWPRIALDGRVLSLPGDLRLDLGATAKAHSADRIAARIAAETGSDVLVELGGDLATAGHGGRLWEVLVQDLPGDPAQQVAIPSGGGVATSSTQKRRWRSDGRTRHHILDPRFGLPAEEVWRTVTVAASDCVRANTLSTAAVVRGLRAPSWLRERGADARLVARDGSIVTTGRWPADPAEVDR